VLVQVRRVDQRTRAVELELVARAVADAYRRGAAVAREPRQHVLLRALDPSGRHLVSTYGGNDADATLLLVASHGFLAENDPKLEATVDFVRRELAAGPYLYRYRAHDGIDGEEGAFVLCGFWLAEALALTGRLDDALRIFSAHVEATNHLGLLAEQLDPTSGELLGNFPQAFSHLGLVNAALRLDRALRLRDEGSHRVPHLVGGVPRIVT